ncbi:hypothetical protein E2562_024138 [Oryza meyeriana var. granulata]|uniref:Uncharacterized protein n=1 Tax=Oryza meyeriana var. granulata TaxID=110450 RepID=A0A6G1EP73_9ORYZ|nr:hypothetical protein E2562_024138 [Oryza meyeriana var. granulata]
MTCRPCYCAVPWAEKVQVILYLCISTYVWTRRMSTFPGNMRRMSTFPTSLEDLKELKEIIGIMATLLAGFMRTASCVFLLPI